ncbi:MAG: hypothetical protein ABL958_05205 [Bdellovibrionia bacterium]
MKWIVAIVVLGAVGALGYVGKTTMSKKQTQTALAASCATSLTTLNARLHRQKLVTYGEFHDYVFKRVSWLNEQLKSKKLNPAEYQNQTVNLFTTYAATSMKTCQAILEPTYKKCTETKDSLACANDASRAFAFGLKLVYDDSVGLKQELDLSRIVAFDIRTAVSQTRPRMPAEDKSQLKGFLAFLK